MNKAMVPIDDYNALCQKYDALELEHQTMKKLWRIDVNADHMLANVMRGMLSNESNWVNLDDEGYTLPSTGRTSYQLAIDGQATLDPQHMRAIKKARGGIQNAADQPMKPWGSNE